MSIEKTPESRPWKWVSLGTVAVLIVTEAAAAIWNFYLRSAAPEVQITSEKKMVFQMPDKPFIAVPPFSL